MSDTDQVFEKLLSQRSSETGFRISALASLRVCDQSVAHRCWFIRMLKTLIYESFSVGLSL